ncbi:MAG: pyridoxal-phosphate dependent enzyme, partial [Bacillales bacterium]
MFTFQDIVHARDMMQGIVEQTPLIHSQTFSSLAENEVFLKLENLQKTGSFKVRGSYNKIYSLKKEELKHGVVAA